jgi:aryl-alcohol dehydrogenase-like predicted oxidoreductase
VNRRTLGRTGLDLLQLHNPPLQLISAMGTYEPLEEMKRDGLIRFYGVSVDPPEEGLAAINATMPDTIQIVYNLARREAEDTFLPTAQPLRRAAQRPRAARARS